MRRPPRHAPLVRPARAAVGQALALALTLALALAVFAPRAWANGSATIARVPIQRVGPTQEEIGRANVETMKRQWLAKRPADVPLRDFLLGEIKRTFADRTFEGIRDPNGVVRILDGHHRASMLDAFAREYGVRYVVRVKIVKDYGGWTFRDYAHHLVTKLGKGQFTRSTRRAHPVKGGADASVARVRRLPGTLAGCKDSPIRSAIGNAMFDAGLRTSPLADYIEFKLADRLARDKHVNTTTSFLKRVNQGGRDAHAVIHELQLGLFSPENLTYLVKQARPGNEQFVRQMVTRFKRSRTYRNARRRALRRVRTRRAR